MWDVGTLAPGESGTIVVTTTLASSAGPVVNNRVVISTLTPESNVDNNEDRESTRVIVDLGIFKEDDPDPVLRGATVAYTLTYYNNGWFDAQEIYITDTLPDGLTFAKKLEQSPGWIGPDWLSVQLASKSSTIVSGTWPPHPSNVHSPTV